jgi:hypothetical protein
LSATREMQKLLEAGWVVSVDRRPVVGPSGATCMRFIAMTREEVGEMEEARTAKKLRWKKVRRNTRH